MNRFLIKSVSLALVAAGLLLFSGCGEKEPSLEEKVLGNWTQYINRAYILLIINPKGVWNSSVRIADATSKIVSKKGDANGTWHMEDGQMIFTVMASNIEKVWEKNDTYFFEIVELGERTMLLKEESGRVAEWNKTGGQQAGETQASQAVVIQMDPVAVNLNKISSGSPDRYLCMSMKMVLKELMPGQEIPALHPKAKEAVILFLSSLIYSDVENFDKVKIQLAKLVNLLNPYMEGFVKDIEVDRVILSSSMDKVEEFIIEHTIGAENPGENAPGKEGEAAQTVEEDNA